MTRFHSAFATHLTAYITLRRRLGCRFGRQAEELRRFDAFVHARRHRALLTEDLARAFAVDTAGTTPAAASRRYLIVRGFAEYLATFEPRTPWLDPQAFGRHPRRRPPYVFTHEELTRLLRGAATYSPRHRALSLAIHAMIGLAASAGLRRREVVGLDVPDVDLDTGVLVVRQSKFHKDRLVPVHATTRDVLRAYAAVRASLRCPPDERAFFLSTRGGRFTPATVDVIFHRLVQRVALHPPCGAPPTFYSLRHTFAVRRLIAWHQTGANVHALLPVLATYMGHIEYTSTAYYLTATAELLAAAHQRVPRLSREGRDGPDT